MSHSSFAHESLQQKGDRRDIRSFNTSSNNASSTWASNLQITSHLPEHHPQSADPFLDPGVYSTAHRMSAWAILSSIALKESVRGNRRWAMRGTVAWFLALGVMGYLTCFVPHKDIELEEEM